MKKVVVFLRDDGTADILGSGPVAEWCQQHNKWVRVAIGNGSVVNALSCEAFQDMAGVTKDFIRGLANTGD